jgi:hypothetical protein
MLKFEILLWLLWLFGGSSLRKAEAALDTEDAQSGTWE